MLTLLNPRPQLAVCHSRDSLNDDCRKPWKHLAIYLANKQKLLCTIFVVPLHYGHPNIQWVELLAWKRHIIVVVDRPNCMVSMDFIWHTEFEGVKILFWQLQCKFLLIFIRGLRWPWQGPRRPLHKWPLLKPAPVCDCAAPTELISTFATATSASNKSASMFYFLSFWFLTRVKYVGFREELTVVAIWLTVCYNDQH